jgi:hypothetical protein
MALVITTTVRNIVAPGTGRPAADAAILGDLATWTLLPTDGRRRTATFVWMFGRQYRYTARLPRFELPQGWCICPPEKAGDCVCREPEDLLRSIAIILTGAKPITMRDRELISTGDSYDTPFTDQPIARDTWWPEAAARWTRVQQRVVRRPEDEAEDPLPRWDRVVKLRRLVVEALAQPLPYEEVDLEEETGLLVFSLARSTSRTVPPDVIYEPAAYRKDPRAAADDRLRRGRPAALRGRAAR